MRFRWQRRVHWWTAGIVFANAALGFAMVLLPLSQLTAKFFSYQLHKSLGITVVLLLALRLALRPRRPRGPEGQVQWALTALLLIVPFLGWITAASAPGDIPTTFFLLFRIPQPMGPDPDVYAGVRELHLMAAMALVGLAVVHGIVFGKKK